MSVNLHDKGSVSARHRVCAVTASYMPSPEVVSTPVANQSSACTQDDMCFCHLTLQQVKDKSHL